MKYMTLNTKEVAAEIRKPGAVFVWARITSDDVQAIEVVKKCLLDVVSDLYNEEFDCIRSDAGLFVGW